MVITSKDKEGRAVVRLGEEKLDHVFKRQGAVSIRTDTSTPHPLEIMFRTLRSFPLGLGWGLCFS